MNDRERKIYDLVVKRFFAVLSEPYEYEQVVVTANIETESFVGKGNTVKKQGWKEIYDQKKQESGKPLSSMKIGDRFPSVTVSMTHGETSPPSHFTEGSLLQAMENPAKYMTSNEKHLAGTINEVGGLGTVATRADVIDKLVNSMYMEMKGKHLFLTSKGRQLLDLVPKDLRSPALTAEWEQKLSLIAEGKLKRSQFTAEMIAYAREVVQEIKQSDVTFKHDNITGTKCPDCDKLMLEINNRHGKMLICQDRSCGHKKNIFKRTKARCPKCRKQLELHGQGEGQTFMCRCGHREKLSTFNKRRQQEKKHQVSKKDVNKYLKKQDDGFKNDALADALAKLKK